MNRNRCGQLLMAGLILVMLGVAVAIYRIGANVRHRQQSMSQRQRDLIRCQLIAMSVNDQQTNWTLMVIPRTNSPSTN